MEATLNWEAVGVIIAASVGLLIPGIRWCFIQWRALCARRREERNSRVIREQALVDGLTTLTGKINDLDVEVRRQGEWQENHDVRDDARFADIPKTFAVMIAAERVQRNQQITQTVAPIVNEIREIGRRFDDKKAADGDHNDRIYALLIDRNREDDDRHRENQSVARETNRRIDEVFKIITHRREFVRSTDERAETESG